MDTNLTGDLTKAGRVSFQHRARFLKGKGEFLELIMQDKSVVVYFFLLLAFLSVGEAGGFSDRVAAFVDDEAITESELQEQHRDTLKINPDITKDEVLNTMINRILILREARKYRIERPSPEEVIKEYIDLKERAFIRVPEWK